MYNFFISEEIHTAVTLSSKLSVNLCTLTSIKVRPQHPTLIWSQSSLDHLLKRQKLCLLSHRASKFSRVSAQDAFREGLTPPHPSLLSHTSSTSISKGFHSRIQLASQVFFCRMLNTKMYSNIPGFKANVFLKSHSWRGIYTCRFPWRFVYF